MKPAPDKIVSLYTEVLANADQDNGTYLGGTDVYNADNVIEEIAGLAGWTLPEITCDDIKEHLRAGGREEEIEYLGVMGYCS